MMKIQINNICLIKGYLFRNSIFIKIKFNLNIYIRYIFFNFESYTSYLKRFNYYIYIFNKY